MTLTVGLVQVGGFPYCRKSRLANEARKQKLFILLGCGRKYFSILSHETFTIFFFLFFSQFPLSTAAWQFNRLQLPAREQVMIIMCLRSFTRLALLCDDDKIGSVKSTTRLRFSGFQFITFHCTCSNCDDFKYAEPRKIGANLIYCVSGNYVSILIL